MAVKAANPAFPETNGWREVVSVLGIDHF